MHWYVIQSRPKQETRAEANLRGWGVDTLLPKLLRPGRSASMRATIEALFPSYLFARFDAATMCAKVRYTRGVAGILGTLLGPTSVDDAVVDLIRERMDAAGLVRMAPTLAAGDRVRIVGGPLKDLLGVFEYSATADQRVSLLLSTVHAQMRVVIDAHLVERVS